MSDEEQDLDVDQNEAAPEPIPGRWLPAEPLVNDSDFPWPADTIDPDDLEPCPRCGSLELWLQMAGDMFGKTPGQWKCQRCEPPTGWPFPRGVEER